MGEGQSENSLPPLFGFIYVCRLWLQDSACCIVLQQEHLVAGSRFAADDDAAGARHPDIVAAGDGHSTAGKEAG